MHLEKLHHRTIAKYLNSDFEVVDGPSDEFKVKLVEVSNHANSPHQEVFSLLFLGPANHFMQQGIHKVKHKELGEMDIFLVPVGQDENGFEYEAVFNRIEAPK